MSQLTPVGTTTPISTATAPSSVPSNATAQFFQFPSLVKELKEHVFSFLDRSTLQAASLASRVCNDPAQIGLTYSLAEELSRFNSEAEGADLASFHNRMERLIQRDPQLALKTLETIQATAANNTDAIVGYHLLLACRAFIGLTELADGYKFTTLTTTVLDIYNKIPPKSPRPLDQAQVLGSNADRVITIIFKGLTQISVEEATSAALNKIPESLLTSSGELVKVEALKNIAEKCLALGNLVGAQKVIETIISLKPTATGITSLLTELCETLVRNGDLKKALSIAEGIEKDHFLYQTLRFAISFALVTRRDATPQDFSDAVEIAFTTQQSIDPEPVENSDYYRITSLSNLANELIYFGTDAAKMAGRELVHRMLPEMRARQSYAYDYHRSLKQIGTAADLLSYAQTIPIDYWKSKLELLIQAAEQLSAYSNDDDETWIQAGIQLFGLKDLLHETQRTRANPEVPTEAQLNAYADKLEALIK